MGNIAGRPSCLAGLNPHTDSTLASSQLPTLLAATSRLPAIHRSQLQLRRTFNPRCAWPQMPEIIRTKERTILTWPSGLCELSLAVATIARASREPMEEKRPPRRQPNDHNFGSLLMLAVTAGGFLLVVWVATKGALLLTSRGSNPLRIN